MGLKQEMIQNTPETYENLPGEVRAETLTGSQQFKARKKCKPAVIFSNQGVTKSF